MTLNSEQIAGVIRSVESSSIRVLRYTTPDFELVVSKSDEDDRGASLEADAPVAATIRRSAPELETEEARVSPATVAAPAEPGMAVVTSPMIGVFYLAPQPDADPFVEVGSRVGEDDTVGLVEAMKLFTAVAAGAAGTVTEILAENGAYVEYGQPLMRVRADQ